MIYMYNACIHYTRGNNDVCDAMFIIQTRARLCKKKRTNQQHRRELRSCSGRIPEMSLGTNEKEEREEAGEKRGERKEETPILYTSVREHRLIIADNDILNAMRTHRCRICT